LPNEGVLFIFLPKVRTSKWSRIETKESGKENEGQSGGEAKCVLFLLYQLVRLVGRSAKRVVAVQEAQRETM
jgi:hypothetical protein